MGVVVGCGLRVQSEETAFVSKSKEVRELRSTKNLESKSSFRPQRVLSRLGETSDTTINRNSIILKFSRLDAYLGIIVL